METVALSQLVWSCGAALSISGMEKVEVSCITSVILLELLFFSLLRILDFLFQCVTEIML